MINIKKPVVLGVVASLALGIFAAVPTAHADPVSNSFVLVGSDTLQDASNAIINGTLASGSSVRTLTGDGTTLGSFDAFGSATIQTKPQGPYFTRPAGSGGGRNALIASINSAQDPNSTAAGRPTIGGQVDIARSSSDWTTNASTSGDLAYVPFGRDAISYVIVGPSAAQAQRTTDVGVLSTAQLKSIYEANTPSVFGSTTVYPLLPQSSSGTRTTFTTAIGVTTLGSAYSAALAGVADKLPENSATVLTPEGNSSIDATRTYVVPFSMASWIAQNNNVAPNTMPPASSAFTVSVGSPNGTAPFTGAAPSLVPSSTFYASGYGRNTYLIVEYARIAPVLSTLATVGTPGAANPKYDAKLAALMDATPATSLANFSGGLSQSTVGAVKRKFGFLALAPADQVVTRAYPNVYPETY